MDYGNEKNAYEVSGGSDSPNGHHGRKESIDMTHVHESGHDRKDSIILQEAADLYGDVQTAEKYGYVARGLKSRHIQFIALGGTIGTGLFLGIGGAFAANGPVSVLLGYTFTGVAVFGMMNCLGEMCTWLPLAGAVPQYCARYVDGAMGFATGWNNWYSNALTLCAELSAAATVIQFWTGDPPSISNGVWIAIIWVLVVCLNIFAVAIYGEAEFVFASIKIITIVGLLLLAFIIDLGGGPSQGRLGFRYWYHPYVAMKSVGAAGAAGRFLGLWSTLVNAAFSYGGVEMVAVAAGEAEDPRRNIPKAVRRVFWRILFFYVLGSLAIGVTVPANDHRLLHGGPGASSSPWVIAIVRAGIPVLPHIINTVILTSASSSANAFLYTGSRYLFSLAQNGQAPKIFLYCTKRGVPVYCVAITSSLGLITFMVVSKGAANIFSWFQTLCAVTSLVTWINILVCYIRFNAACRAQGVKKEDMAMSSKGQPAVAWVCLIFFSLILFFNGWQVFLNGAWSAEGFVGGYIVIPIYAALFIGWKLVKRTKFIKASEADLWTGKASIDAEIWPERKPRNMAERVWFWIA